MKTTRKPEWLKIKIDTSGNYSKVQKIVQENSLNTICSSGLCPNKGECWSRGTATFMILGEVCTRSCRFCATKTGKPEAPDPEEAGRIANAVSLMKLKHCVITSVTRDDLPDQGASHWASVIEMCREKNPDTTIEVLLPDFGAKKELIATVAETKPDIISHNIETVKRLTSATRSKADYNTSLDALKIMADSGILTKSSIMLGLGESPVEVKETIKDLYNAGCRILCIGQYLQPTRNHLQVEEYITPERFLEYKNYALKIGFSHVESGPLVRSSYMSDNAMSKLRPHANIK